MLKPIMKLAHVIAIAFVATFLGSTAQTQDRSSQPLPVLPQIYETSDYTIRVVELATGLSNPWSMAFLPNGDVLVTERAGRLRILRDGVLDPGPIPGVPEVRTTVLGGLLDVLTHPEFSTNTIIYLSYSKAIDEDLSTTAIARARFDGESLKDLEEIFVVSTRSTSPTNVGGRMVFGTDGHLYVTIGERQEQERAQGLMDHGGKILQLRDDGAPPGGNPFVDDPGYLPEIYTLGHRSPQGLAVHPEPEPSGRTNMARWVETNSTFSLPDATTDGRWSPMARTTMGRRLPRPV